MAIYNGQCVSAAAKRAKCAGGAKPNGGLRRQRCCMQTPWKSASTRQGDSRIEMRMEKGAAGEPALCANET